MGEDDGHVALGGGFLPVAHHQSRHLQDERLVTVVLVRDGALGDRELVAGCWGGCGCRGGGFQELGFEGCALLGGGQHGHVEIG